MFCASAGVLLAGLLVLADPHGPSGGGQISSASADPRLSAGQGWGAGTIAEQLDRDPTLVPFGKGSIFVPAMTNPLDEPPISVFHNERLIAEGTSGARIVLLPGTYEVRIGSGSEHERLRFQASVREQTTTVVPVSWSGLAVHVIDPQYTSIRGSYELIRVDDREYMGLGFGADEQAGEPISTWILRPGLYKVVRVGETYRARRDFTTVRLLPGRLTHFQLVIDEETGSFAGGGELPEDELFRPTDGFFGSLILGGDASVNQVSNVPGLPDGVRFTLRAFLDSRLAFEIADSPLLVQLQVEEGLTKGLDQPYQKSPDRLKLDALYVYQLEKWIGPYARAGAETNLFAGFEYFEGANATFLDVDGTKLRDAENVYEVKLSPPFGLTLLKEGVGLNVRVLKTVFGEMTVRSGLGARHRIANDLLEVEETRDVPPRFVFRRIGSTDQVGVEGTVAAVARLTRWVLANLEVDALVPFDGWDRTVLEVSGSVAFKLTSYVGLNYVLRYRRDRALSETDAIEQDVRLRFSLELL